MNQAIFGWAAVVMGTSFAAGCSSGPLAAGQDSGSGAESGTQLDAAGKDSEAASDGSTADLHWYFTCGDPVCRAPNLDGGVEADGGVQDAGMCPGIGASCSTMGQTCGAPTNCNSVETCLDHDPQKAGGCPLSSRKFKDDIEYLDPAQLERLHDEVLRLRLATYNYKGQYADPNPKHLGFIVEDNPQSLAVDRGHDRVDVYGYLSMVVAAMQVQEKEIAALSKALEGARRDARACRPDPRAEVLVPRGDRASPRAGD